VLPRVALAAPLSVVNVGAPAAGKIGYEYRVDLTQAVTAQMQVTGGTVIGVPARVPPH
jgi:hypothetical protein